MANHIRTSVPSDFVFPVKQGSILNSKTYTEHREIHVRGGVVSSSVFRALASIRIVFFQRASDWSHDQRLGVQLKHGYFHIWV